MESYYEKLNEYYRQKNSGIKCKGCKEKKIFKEENGILSFSCGGKDNCSKSFTIKLSKYINFVDTLNDFNLFLSKQEKIKESEKKVIRNQLEEILKLGKKQIIKNNDVINKKNHINSYNDLKIKTKIEQSKLLNDINDNDYSGNIDKNELIKRYHSLNNILSEKYNQLCELYETPQDNYIMIDKGN
tara:strand:- start:829 stop:1386 length:558 start_codon:yes stop_codon:yes gene_type:complete